MRNYIIRRVLLMIPTLFLVSLIIFGTLRLIPGDVVDVILDTSNYVTDADKAALEELLGLNLPFYEQYGKWVGDIILHGDFGQSLIHGSPVMELIKDRVPISLELGLLGITMSLIFAIPIGVYSAIRQDSMRDYAGRSISMALIAVPNFWIATLVVIFPAIWWGWSPSLQYVSITENFGGHLIQFGIPAIILGMGFSGSTMRMIRTMMLEVLRQDYIRTAWSKGLKEKAVIFRHAMKNAMIPVITIVGHQIPIAINSAVILETIFNLPGIGTLAIDALNTRDYTVVAGINVFASAAILLVNLSVDLTYAQLDPRVHYR